MTTYPDLAGKAALVVGATQGLGRATALRLAEEGAKVALVARTPAALDVVAARARAGSPDVIAIPADFTDNEQVVAAVQQVRDRFGTIDILVNTVGVCDMTDGALAGDEEIWHRAFESIVMAAVRACRAVVPVMLDQDRGAVVNVCANSIRHYIPAIAHYSAMKIALAHFTKNLSRECATTNVRINAVMPGFIGSEQVDEILKGLMAEHDVDEHGAFEILNRDILHTANFTNRIGDPAEYAAAIAFLVSDQASYINGAWLNVDGGSPF